MNEIEGRWPIIVAGMHRSGTSLITRVLRRLGVFVGRWVDENSEAIFFQNLNNWILRQAGASWDSPGGMRALLGEEGLQRCVVDRLAVLCASPRVALFLGLAGYARYHSAFRIVRIWGWKDPRNTLTLPIWRQVFPQCRIIHVMRHGVDVAASLSIRAREYLVRSKKGNGLANRLDRWIGPRLPLLTHSARCLSLDGAFSLWEEYMLVGRTIVEESKENSLEICFEDFVGNRYAMTARLSEFAGLSPNEGRIRQAVQDVNPSAAFRFLKDRDLREFAVRQQRGLVRFGYDETGTSRPAPLANNASRTHL